MLLKAYLSGGDERGGVASAYMVERWGMDHCEVASALFSRSAPGGVWEVKDGEIH